MLIRDLDRAEEDVRQLKRLLAGDLTANQRFMTEAELRRMVGNPGKTLSPAQILDFYCSDGCKWAVLHNLKLKGSCGLERIDHLVISRYFDVVLLNSACFYHDLKISVNGEYKLFDGREYQPIVSPEQKCRRQLDILTEVFDEAILVPNRLGVPLRPKLHAVVLLSPSQNVIRPPACILDTSHVMAANRFVHKLLRHQIRRRRGLSKLGILARYCPRSTLERIARELAALHESACIDFAAEMGIDPNVCRQPRREAPNGRLPAGFVRHRATPQASDPPDPQPFPDSFGGIS